MNVSKEHVDIFAQPLITFNTPSRFYYAFGRPIQTTPDMANDKAKCEEVYAEVSFFIINLLFIFFYYQSFVYIYVDPIQTTPDMANNKVVVSMFVHPIQSHACYCLKSEGNAELERRLRLGPELAAAQP